MFGRHCGNPSVIRVLCDDAFVKCETYTHWFSSFFAWNCISETLKIPYYVNKVNKIPAPVSSLGFILWHFNILQVEWDPYKPLWCLFRTKIWKKNTLKRRRTEGGMRPITLYHITFTILSCLFHYSIIDKQIKKK